MKTGAVIAEYNIFHNGHKYLIDCMRKECSAVVAIMSGNMVQRGDVAITDKWTRAKMALLNGVDLVIELPSVYALNTAQKFAFGAVNILNSLNIIDELYFGSEDGDTAKLIHAAELLENEPPEISEKIKALLDSGLNYPTARQMAYENLLSDILKTPNNILAIEYIRSLMQLNSSITPKTTERTGTGYHDLHAEDNIASASAIRNMIKSGENYSEYIPLNICTDFIQYDLKNIDNIILHTLRNADVEYIKNINDVSEGLENRIKKLSYDYGTVQSLIDNIKTKRYTRTRINRIVLSCVLGLTKDLCAKTPSYVRVLGMNKTGMSLLNRIKDASDLHIITKTADFKQNDEIFNAEIRTTDLFALACNDADKRISGLDFKTSPVIIP